MGSFEIKYKAMQPWGAVFAREQANPLDLSSIFSSKLDAERYALGKGDDERGIGGVSYVGQIITVYEKGSVEVYKIEEDRSLGSIGGTNAIEVDYYENLKDQEKLKLGQLIKVKNSFNPSTQTEHLAGFYIYTGNNTFSHLSTSTGETNEIEALSNALELVKGTVDGIKDDIYVLTDGNYVLDVYTKAEVSSEITEALKTYVTTGALTETLKSYALASDVTTGLNSKVDNTTLEAYQKTVSDTYATKTELAGKSDSTHNHDNAYAGKTAFEALEKKVNDRPSKYFIKKVDSATYAASYELWQTVGETSSKVDGAATIDIPKDMVVESGEVVELKAGDVAGKDAGTYIKLVLANATNDTLYIPANKLVDAYTGSDYVTVDGYTISLNVSNLATKLTTEKALTDKFVDKNDLSSTLETLQGDLEDYAEEKAGDAQTAAINHTNTELAKYLKSDEAANTYVKSADYAKDKKDLSDDISANATAIEDLDKIVKDEAKGNAALKTAIDDVNKIVTDEAKGNAALKTAIEGVDSALETLGKAVVKTVKIGDTALTTTNNTVTIELVSTIDDNAQDAGIPSVGAVKDALSNINDTVAEKTTIIDVTATGLPAVADAVESAIYIDKKEGKKAEHTLIGGAFYQFGSDVYARNDVMASPNTYSPDGSPLTTGDNGLMSSDDKTKLDSISAIPISTLRTLFES